MIGCLVKVIISKYYEDAMASHMAIGTKQASVYYLEIMHYTCKAGNRMKMVAIIQVTTSEPDCS